MNSDTLQTFLDDAALEKAKVKEPTNVYEKVY